MGSSPLTAFGLAKPAPPTCDRAATRFTLPTALSVPASKQFDKKGAVLLGGILSIVCNVVLGVLFLTGVVPIGGMIALAIFVLFHASYWLGNGIMLSVSTAMIADVSAIHLARSGVNKDGAYSAVFSLSMRLAISFALLGSGWILNAIGFSANAAHGGAPTPEAVWRLGAAMLLLGPLISIGGLLAIRKYPITRSRLDSLLNKVECVIPT